MKRITMTAIVLCIIGCGNDAEAKIPVTKEIASTANLIVVPNTEYIDYATYRQEWRRINDKHAPKWAPDFTLSTRTRKDPEDKHEIVEIELNDLEFKDAFRLEFLGKGEGHTFWWRGMEYTTNLLEVVRRPELDNTDIFIEKVTHPVDGE